MPIVPTKDIPLNMPCSDPEGCKHFKAEMKLNERIKELEEKKEKLKEAIICFLDRWKKSGPSGSAQWEKFNFSIQILEQALKGGK